ncbi:uncharacterized protein K02A2.6-like [Branchiostoma floridae]|uniref:Uncharacterized protein K02A2.6-like n=1 Tax=Branchiostoma floridae TaxID=7739 RepID=A0A9J7LBD7_BRAFL|nr:uncharacterized protein K02A2.6-like [Branchiostoma floridae]
MIGYSALEWCQTVGTRQQKETLLSHPVPMRPWEKVGIDMFNFRGKEYLITVDYFSNFFEIDNCVDTARSATIIKKLKMQFARHGIPDTVMSDNGPQFLSAEFETFSKEWHFHHITLSPGYPQSNGKSENAVKTVKKLMEKALLAKMDPYLALLDFRNTPTQGVNSSPVQRLFGRRTRTTIPMTTALLTPEPPRTQETPPATVTTDDVDHNNATEATVNNEQPTTTAEQKPTNAEQTTTRSGRIVRTPAHLKDFVKYSCMHEKISML